MRESLEVIDRFRAHILRIVRGFLPHPLPQYGVCPVELPASPVLRWVQCSYWRSLSPSTHCARLENSVSAGYFRTVTTLMLAGLLDSDSLILTMGIDSLVTLTLKKNDEIKHFGLPLWIWIWLESCSSPSTARLDKLESLVNTIIANDIVRCDASYLFSTHRSKWLVSNDTYDIPTCFGRAWRFELTNVTIVQCILFIGGKSLCC